MALFAVYKNYKVNKHTTMLTNDIIWSPNSYISKNGFVNTLEGLIKNNYSIHAILTNNGWLEFDTINDYKLYKEMLDKKILKKLIRLNY